MESFLARTKIALDYDETYTRLPHLWDAFIKHAKSLGNVDISFVTFRYPHETNGIVEDAKRLHIPIVFTSRQQKRTKFKADIWIDDMPELIPLLQDPVTSKKVEEHKAEPTSLIMQNI